MVLHFENVVFLISIGPALLKNKEPPGFREVLSVKLHPSMVTLVPDASTYNSAPSSSAVFFVKVVFLMLMLVTFQDRTHWNVGNKVRWHDAGWRWRGRGCVPFSPFAKRTPPFLDLIF